MFTVVENSISWWISIFLFVMQSNKCTISKSNGTVFDWKIGSRAWLMGYGCLVISLWAHGWQTRCQIYWKHSWKWTGWKGNAFAYDSIFGVKLCNRSVYTLAARQYSHPYSAIHESWRICHFKGRNLWWRSRKVWVKKKIIRKLTLFLLKFNFTIQNIQIQDSILAVSIWIAISLITLNRTRNVSNRKPMPLKSGYRKFNSYWVDHYMVAHW